MFNFGKLRNLFNPPFRELVEQPKPQDLTPFDLPPLSYENKKYSDKERDTALEQFQSICTQEYIEIVADELAKKPKYCHSLRILTDLFTIAEDISDENEKPNWVYFLGRAVRYRDAQFAKLIANEAHTPFSEIYNPIFQKKMEEHCSSTAKPALRIV